MRVYQTKGFARFARKAGLTSEQLLGAAAEVANGACDADLGGGVFKQRVARPGGGKSGGFRTILLCQAGRLAFFVHGFAKSEKANVSAKELKALKRLADEMLGFSAGQIRTAQRSGELIEVAD
jgi:hypothetical protein